MRKIYLTLAAVVVALGAAAQSAPTKMNIKLNNSAEVITYNVSDIEEITFTGDEQPGGDPLPVDAKTYVITIPTVTDDLEPGVWKVMNGDQQVAELCYEYIKYVNGDQTVDINERMLVLYPMGQDGRADLTKGYIVRNGGSLVWNAETNTCTYAAGTETSAPATVFMAEGRFATASEAADKVATTQVKDQLVDKRVNETEVYDVVKVGTQYWMGQNLRTTMLTDGRSITMYKATQGDGWNSTTAPAYHIFGDGEITDIKPTWGCMYNGYSITDGTLVPDGWDVTTIDDWRLLKSYLVSGQSGKVKSTTEWNESAGNGNNLTGLNIEPGGFFRATSQTTDEQQWSYATYWTSTGVGQSLAAVYVYKSIVIDSTLYPGELAFIHDGAYGHYVRCLRR